MLNGMITTKTSENDEVVTKGWFRGAVREAIREAVDELAMLINKSFVGVETRMAKQDDLLALTERVVGLEKDMRGMDNNFAVVFGELKSIRKRLDHIEKNDSSADVVNLDLRVRKLEKRAGLQ